MQLLFINSLYMIFICLQCTYQLFAQMNGTNSVIINDYRSFLQINKSKNIVKRSIGDLSYESSMSAAIIGPRCIPLTSKNIEANPYHPALLSIPGKQVRKGFGMPIILSVKPMICNKDATKSCSQSVSESVTKSVSNSYSISLGQSKSFSKSVTDSQSRGTSNSYTKSMGKTIEKSLSKSLTLTDEVSLSETLSESILNTHEKSSGFSSTKSFEESNSNTLSQDLTSTSSINSEVSVTKSFSIDLTSSRSKGGSETDSRGGSNDHSSGDTNTVEGNVGFSICGFGIGGGGSESWSNSDTQSNNWGSSEETNWNNQNSESIGANVAKTGTLGSSKSLAVGIGRSNARTNTFGSSSTSDNRVSDSISFSRENARTNTRSKSSSTTDSETNSESYTVDDSFTSSSENSITNTFGTTTDNSNSITKDNSTSITFSFTLTDEKTFDVPPGTCKVPVCLPFVKAIAIPFECVDRKTAPTVPLFADYMFDFERNEKGELNCAYSLIDCKDKDNANLFLIDNEELENSDKYNSIDYGRIISAPFSISSKHKKFTLELKKNGELILRRQDKEIWSNGMGFFDESKTSKSERSDDDDDYGDDDKTTKKQTKTNNYEIRLRLNEKGHLIEEVKGLFTIFSKLYRKDEWVVVWSTAPINHNVTIGISSIVDKEDSYKLILEDNGRLKLYDAVGSLIWCATDVDNQECKHRFGYKFPEVYLVPTNMITPQDKDTHNSINSKIVFRKTLKSIKSLDEDCDSSLMENEGFSSPNQRFKVILEESGNLVIKDNYRTMWESASGFLPHVEGPLKLVLTPTGNILILDSNKLIVWTSFLTVANSTRPYELRMLDTGRLVVTDKNKLEIWESTPMRGMSRGNTVLVKINYRFVKCHGKLPRRSKSVKFLKSNMRNNLVPGEKLISKNKLYNLELRDDQLLLNSKCLFFNSNKVLKLLKIKDDGNLILVNIYNETVWKSNSRFVAGVYRTIVTDSGEITTLNKTGHVLWTLRGCNNDQTIHIIKANDNCFNVANEYKVSLKSLTVNNPKIECKNLQIGHTLCIPKKAESILTKNLRLFNDFKAFKTSSSDECWSDCVSTPDCIASSFYGKEKDIEKNCYLFKEGFVPRKNLDWITQSNKDIYSPICASGKEYTVKKDDTCYKISSIYDISVDSLTREDNEINCDYLPIGYTLCIPNVLFKLRSRANNNYITVNSDNNLIASVKSFKNAAKFEIIHLTSTQIAIKSVSNGMFVGAADYGNKELSATSNLALEWETFELIELPDGTKGFKAMVNGKYVSAENQGNSPLIANRDSISGSWEAFEMINV